MKLLLEKQAKHFIKDIVHWPVNSCWTLNQGKYTFGIFITQQQQKNSIPSTNKLWPKIFSENIDPFLNIPLNCRIILWQTSAFLAKRLEYWMRNFLQAQWIYSVIIQRWNKIYSLYLANKTISYFFYSWTNENYSGSVIRRIEVILPIVPKHIYKKSLILPSKHQF